MLLLPGLRFVPALRAAAAVLCIVPSPRAGSYYTYVWDVDYRSLEARYTTDDAYLALTLAGYPDTRKLLDTPEFRQPDKPRALIVNTETEYYFRRAGVQTVGDWVGPGRFAGLATALDNGRLRDYLTYFDIGGIVFKRGGQKFFTEDQVDTLVRELPALGFRIMQNDPNGYLIAVRSKPA